MPGAAAVRGCPFFMGRLRWLGYTTGRAGPMSQIECAECGVHFPNTQSFHPRRFCGEACQRVWKNRRAQRGGLLYDMLMTQRYDRGHQNEARIVLQNLARSFRDSDKRHRAGRRSWKPFREALKLLPVGYSTDGDKR